MRDEALVLASYRGATPGELISFGAYPQEVDGEEKTPIQWRVLQNAGGKLFLLSEFLLDCKRYHREYVDTSWHDCDLREWLNHEFFLAAFDESEARMIATTSHEDNDGPGPNAEDKVFLLSVAEVHQVTEALGKEWRRAMGTPFAQRKKRDGCSLYVYDKGVDEDYLTHNGHRHGCSWWWLRSQVREPSRASFVGMRATIRNYGRVNLPYYGIRPALILDCR